MFPPHLPAPSCNINKHRSWQRIKILLAAAVFGLVAGLSGAAMMLGWVWPGYGGGEDFSLARYSLPGTHAQLESQVRQEVTERLARIYSGTEYLRGVEFLPQKNFLGNGLLVSSDGWLVVYPGNYSGSYRNWRAVMANGTVYEAGTIIPDKISGLVFVHLDLSKNENSNSGMQFKVAAFADSLGADSDLFVFNGFDWQAVRAEPNTIDRSAVAAHLDSAPTQKFSLDSDFAAGNVVVNNAGRVAGLTLGGREFLPYQYIARLLPGVLDSQKIVYPSLGVEGWYGFEQPLIVDHETLSGFYITKSASSQLRPGDIILTINGQVLNSDKLWYNTRVGEILKLKIWRAGAQLDLEVPVVAK